MILWTAVDRSPSDFLITRFSRLYPIFWVSIGITLFAKWWVYDDAVDVGNVLRNMTMIPGYLGQDFRYIDGVYWTLQVELKFYFLLFLLIIFKQLHRVEHWLIAWTAGCILAPHVPGLSSLTIYPYGPYFIAGATMFLIWRDKLTATRIAIVIVCLIMSIYEIDRMVKGWLFTQLPYDIFVSSIIVTVFYAVMVGVALGHVRMGEKIFIFKLAMMTYPLYLLHNVTGNAIIDSLQINKYLSLVITLFLIFSLSYIAIYIDKYLNKKSNTMLTGLRNYLLEKYG